MASDVDIANYALTLLGESRIMSLDDDVKAARECKAVYEIVRDSVLSAHNWSFAKSRAALSRLDSTPVFGFANEFQLPVDCLRLFMVGDIYVGVDLSDYRNAPTDEYTIEDRKILTDWGAPLNIRYIRRVEDTARYSSTFVDAFGARIAERLAEPLTQSAVKREAAKDAYKAAISEAVRVNAIEQPPQKIPDDEWLLSRR